jgi:phenylpyruvate tautomerase PptA (4-oxalocrotonate tautomerase family)
MNSQRNKKAKLMSNEAALSEWLQEEKTKATLVDQIMDSAQQLGDKDPELLDMFVSEIIPTNWKPTKAC